MAVGRNDLGGYPGSLTVARYILADICGMWGLTPTPEQLDRIVEDAVSAFELADVANDAVILAQYVYTAFAARYPLLEPDWAPGVVGPEFKDIRYPIPENVRQSLPNYNPLTGEVSGEGAPHKEPEKPEIYKTPEEAFRQQFPYKSPTLPPGGPTSRPSEYVYAPPAVPPPVAPAAPTPTPTVGAPIEVVSRPSPEVEKEREARERAEKEAEEAKKEAEEAKKKAEEAEKERKAAEEAAKAAGVDFGPLQGILNNVVDRLAGKLQSPGIGANITTTDEMEVTNEWVKDHWKSDLRLTKEAAEELTKGIELDKGPGYYSITPARVS
jgi:hypothetical protein